jgi:PBP1b-binding outer membrane lipoprotein LpoB
MNKTFYILLLGLTLLGCVATASAVKTLQPAPPAVIIEQNHDEMLELAHDMEEERVKTIYVVVISEPEIVTAKPPEK